MIPAAVVDDTIAEIAPHLEPDDILIDGGNSYYIDDIRRSEQLAKKGIHYVDVGTSGGVWGLESGYCLMIGGDTAAVERLDPIFKTIAPGVGDIPRTVGRDKIGGSAEEGYLHCGPSGGGHFVKMVHNGIEYGIMAAYAEGLNILHHANVGNMKGDIDAETTPLRDPEHYQFDFNLSDVAEVWRRGSVISSWLLDLTAAALPRARPCRSLPATFPIQAKVVGPSRLPLTKAYPPRSSPPRSTSVSALAAKPTLQTSFFPPCASNSEATSKSQQSNVQTQIPPQRSPERRGGICRSEPSSSRQPENEKETADLIHYATLLGRDDNSSLKRV